MPTTDPLTFLRELLADDRAAGIELDGATFAQRVHLVARETRCGRSWRWAMIDTYPAWASAYTGTPGGELARFSRDLLDDEGTREGLDDPGGI